MIFSKDPDQVFEDFHSCGGFDFGAKLVPNCHSAMQIAIHFISFYHYLKHTRSFQQINILSKIFP